MAVGPGPGPCRSRGQTLHALQAPSRFPCPALWQSAVSLPIMLRLVPCSFATSRMPLSRLLDRSTMRADPTPCLIPTQHQAQPPLHSATPFPFVAWLLSIVVAASSHLHISTASRGVDHSRRRQCATRASALDTLCRPRRISRETANHDSPLSQAHTRAPHHSLDGTCQA